MATVIWIYWLIWERRQTWHLHGSSRSEPLAITVPVWSCWLSHAHFRLRVCLLQLWDLFELRFPFRFPFFDLTCIVAFCLVNVSPLQAALALSWPPATTVRTSPQMQGTLGDRWDDSAEPYGCSCHPKCVYLFFKYIYLSLKQWLCNITEKPLACSKSVFTLPVMLDGK